MPLTTSVERLDPRRVRVSLVGSLDTATAPQLEAALRPILAEAGTQTSIHDVLQTGLLPGVRSEPDIAIDILEAYAANYLHQEIQQEALTKDLAGFARFLRVAAVLNGQIVNVSNVASEAEVARSTVQ